MLLVEKIVQIGVGQAGCNIVSELEQFNFNAFYINTSLEDLNTINTDKKNKYHIKNSNGLSKDRSAALQCVLKDNNAENIAYAINDQFSMTDIIFFCYSLSGGTGGGMSGYIIEQFKDLFPDKIINVIAILPKSNEDVGLQANAIEALEHLKKLQSDGIVTQIHLLDNNTRENVFSINNDFAISLNKFVNFDQINKTGKLDENEKERLLKEPGMGVILDFSNEDFGNGLADVSSNTIYAKWLRNPSLHGLILNKKQNIDLNKQLIKDLLGMATYTHQTEWEDEGNIIISVGMDFNDNILNQMKKNAQELLEKKKQIEEESRKEIIETIEFDTKQITRKSSKRTPINDEQRNIGASRRRRSSEKTSSILDKYRNM